MKIRFKKDIIGKPKDCLQKMRTDKPVDINFNSTEEAKMFKDMFDIFKMLFEQGLTKEEIVEKLRRVD